MNDDLYETIEQLQREIRKLKVRVMHLEEPEERRAMSQAAAQVVSNVIDKAMEHYAVHA